MTWEALAVLLAAIGGQTFWIARALNEITTRLDRIEATVLRDHGERIARLEERTGT